MKRALLFSLLVFGLALATTSFNPPTSGRGIVIPQGSSAWNQQTSGTTNELRSIHFFNENEGWTAGANATLLRTSNGGANWSPVSNTGVDAGNGFNAVRVIDQNTIWVGGRSVVARTTTGGMGWGGQQWSAASSIPLQNSLFPLSANVAWAVGPGPRTHLRHEFLTSFFFSEVFNQTSPELNDIYFVPAGAGWAVGNTGQVIRISNAISGAGFTQQMSGTTQALNGIYLLDVNAGWIVGNSGTILKTINGGSAWTVQTSGTMTNLRDVHFVDANRGWAVGDGGVILTTSDGGATWSPEQSGVTTNLRSVFFVNTNTGFAVGDGGTILKRGAPSGPTAVTTVSAASFTGTELAPESIAAAFGQGFATGTETATSVPLPTTLAGASVRVRDSAGTERAAPLFFVSPMQINYLIPPGTAPGAASISVVRGEAVVAAGTAPIMPIAPGLFAANANGQGVAAAVVFRRKADGSESFEPVAQFNQSLNRFVAVPIDLGPATDQISLILSGTGIRFRSALSAVTCMIGGASAPVSFAGAQGGFVGLDQINISLPRSLAGRGEVDVVLTADGKTANTVKVTMK